MAVLSLGPVLSHILIVLVAMLNICILSYDAGMINNLNAVKPYNDYFNLNSDLIGLNVAIISAGSVLGAPVVGPAVDRWGRKMGLAAGSICIIVGVILQASASAVPQLIVGRFIIGFASLVNGSIAPMWVMELASPKHRTICSSTVLVSVPFTSFLVACIVLGIFDKDSNWVWRGIMLGEAVPSIISLCLLPFVDESPRWLFSKGRAEEATEILARLHADGDVHNVEVLTEAQEIVASLNQEKDGQGAWRELITPASNMKRFTIAVLTNIFYQILGGNMILYFSSYIISSLGVSSRRSIITINIALLLWKAFCSILGVFLIDRVGARKPLLAGTSATVILFGLLSGLSYLTEVHPDNNSYAIGSIVVVALFLLAVSTSWMILAYTYPPEILRYSQRAKGVVVAQAIGYAFSFLNLYTAPLAIERISWRYYAINGGWNLGILAVVYCLFVETKGRTLEEIDEVFDGVVYSNDVIIDAQGSKGTLEQDGEDNKRLTKRKLRKVDSAN
ncbi:High-affinity glucose transporter [Colletotrichum tropicale]|nr:High-affinity glucose transporter [Colletotrichum tropicale]